MSYLIQIESTLIASAFDSPFFAFLWYCRLLFVEHVLSCPYFPFMTSPKLSSGREETLLRSVGYWFLMGIVRRMGYSSKDFSSFKLKFFTQLNLNFSFFIFIHKPNFSLC